MAVTMPAGVTVKAVFTADDMERIQAATGKDLELVRGELYEVTPPTGIHGKIQGRMFRYLDEWAEASDAGDVFVESGFKLESDPDTVLGPDVSFVKKGRITEEQMDRGSFPLGPDVAVEVRSPNDTWKHLEEKASYYFGAGTKLVMLVEPRRFVELLRPSGERNRLGLDNMIQADDVLPGFRCKVRDLFPKGRS